MSYQSITSIGAKLSPLTQQGTAAISLLRSIEGTLRECCDSANKKNGFNSSGVQLLRDCGLLSAAVPTNLGGLGVDSLYDLCVLQSRLGQIDASIAVGVSMHMALSHYFVRAAKAEPQQPNWTEWISMIGARAMTLASAVSEAGRTTIEVETSALFVKDQYVVNGTKVVVSIAPSATHFYTRLRVGTETGEKLASAMIPSSLKGVEVTDDWAGAGLATSGSGSVKFSDVRIDASSVRIVGSWGIQDARTFGGRAAASIPILASFLGVAEAAFEIIETEVASPDRRTRTRVNASSNLSKLADARIAIGVIRAVLHHVMLVIDEQTRLSSTRSLDTDTGIALLKDCTLAALVVEQFARKLVDNAFAFVGARAFNRNHFLARMDRDLRAMQFMRPFSPPEQCETFLCRDMSELNRCD